MKNEHSFAGRQTTPQLGKAGKTTMNILNVAQRLGDAGIAASHECPQPYESVPLRPEAETFLAVAVRPRFIANDPIKAGGRHKSDRMCRPPAFMETGAVFRVLTHPARVMSASGLKNAVIRTLLSRTFSYTTRLIGPSSIQLVIVAFLVLLSSTNQSAYGEVNAASVQRAIDRGITYLRKSQNDRGGWDEFTGQSCGLSALCTLAMLNSGVSKNDPDLVQAMRYLRGFEPTETYSVALQTLVFCQLGEAGYLKQIRDNVQLLVDSQITSGPSAGGWDYGGRRGSGDPSNAQFAILALGAAHDRGIEVDPETFEAALKYWLDRQARDGGWAYSGARQISGSMTCAGVASLIITKGRLGDGSSSIIGDEVKCCGSDAGSEDPVEAGLAWLGRNFSTEVNPGSNFSTFFYYIYALERVGRLSGRRFIGDHDWYREGADRLIEMQDDFQGYWKGNGPLEGDTVATSFALLFLSKGKRQVVAGRLKYADAQDSGQWNRHPDSLRQLVRHVEQDWGRDLTWQTIDSESASLTDLLHAPVLVISGQRPLNLSGDLSKRLRDYVDQGGTLFFEAEGGSGCGDASGFQRSVTRWCAESFPGSALERLPPDHPVWFAQHRVDVSELDEDFWIYGVQACCRTSVFFVPHSLSCRWELADVLFRSGNYQSPARAQIKAATRIGENVIAYATGRELKDKLENRFVINSGETPELTPGTILLASLAVDAGGEDARRALPNAVNLIAGQGSLRVSAASEPVGFDAESLRDVLFLWVHGRTDFTWDAAQRQTLRDFISRGGYVIGSSVCGAEAFSKGFRREIQEIFPDSPLQPIAPDHPLMSVPRGFKLSSITTRTPGGAGKELSKRVGPPILEIANVSGLAAVFYSPLDLSCALESPNSVQCPGYNTEDSAKIVTNIVLYGMNQ